MREDRGLPCSRQLAAPDVSAAQPQPTNHCTRIFREGLNLVSASRWREPNPLVVAESYVQQGMRIGYTTDYFGNKLADVITPVSGVVVYICSVPSMKKGDT